jgi:hypothetical protein
MNDFNDSLEAAPYDWNFDDVPENELAACCLWEYGRESVMFAMSSSHLAEIREAMRAGKRVESDPPPEYEEFLNAYWNSDEGYMKFYETIRNYGGPGALPWQLIDAAHRVNMSKDVGVHEVSWPLTEARREQLEKLWKANLVEWEPVRQQPNYEPADDSMAWEASKTLLDAPGHAGAQHGEMLVAFAVDFRKFTDKEISAAFVAWIKQNRPKESPGPTKRGRKTRDIRVALDRLGIMRLLSFATLREMPEKYPDAWKAFEGYDWYKERKRARSTFLRFFPFLPKSDLPLSWGTKGRRSKWVANDE